MDRVYPCGSSAQADKDNPMNTITDFISWLFDADQRNLQARDEAYLADAADIYELEYRMRKLDRRRPFGPFGQNA